MTVTSIRPTPTNSFVDTGAWCALAIADDKYHAQAATHYLAQIRAKTRFITSDYILDETITRLRYDYGHAAAVAFYTQIRATEAESKLKILRVDTSVWDAAMEIFARYDDQIFSFTDCTSFVLARQANVDDIFGFDNHFRTMGFTLLPAL